MVLVVDNEKHTSLLQHNINCRIKNFLSYRPRLFLRKGCQLCLQFILCMRKLLMGAMTFNITTFSTMASSIKTFSIMTLSIKTFSITRNWALNIVMLRVMYEKCQLCNKPIMLSLIMVNVLMLNVVKLNVVAPFYVSAKIFQDVISASFSLRPSAAAGIEP